MVTNRFKPKRPAAEQNRGATPSLHARLRLKIVMQGETLLRTREQRVRC
jgi:hypothetical protein